MEDILKEFWLNHDINEDSFIKKVDKLLEKGTNIDQIFVSYPRIGPRCTLLQVAINKGYNKIVKFALDNRADMAKAYETQYPFNEEEEYCLRGSWNCLEYALMKYCEIRSFKYGNCFEHLRNEYLANYSVYGLHSLHIGCAMGDWSEIEKYLTSNLVNKSINVRSPVWPGMNPMLIASKFGRRDVMNRLVEVGASPLVKDSEGNTVLHYLSTYAFCDKKFFIYNEDTFGNCKGMSHFHIACMFCPETIDIVENYLQQGISPDLEIKETEIDRYPIETGHTGLHLAAYLYNGEQGVCPALARLLLEYGADVDKKDGHQETAFDIVSIVDDKTFETTNYTEFFCVLIEAGANFDQRNMDKFIQEIKKSQETMNPNDNALLFLRCVQKMWLLDKKLIPEYFENYYYDLAMYENFDGYEYDIDCKEELDKLSKIGLDRILRDYAVTPYFKQKWGALVGSSDLPRQYPIYGNLLKIKLRNRLFDFEKKKEKVNIAKVNIQYYLEYSKKSTICLRFVPRRYYGISV